MPGSIRPLANGGKVQSKINKNVIFSIQKRDSTQHRYFSEAGFQLVKEFPAFEET
jgi:hypothetical protein